MELPYMSRNVGNFCLALRGYWIELKASATNYHVFNHSSFSLYPQLCFTQCWEWWRLWCTLWVLFQWSRPWWLGNQKGHEWPSGMFRGAWPCSSLTNFYNKVDLMVEPNILLNIWWYISSLENSKLINSERKGVTCCISCKYWHNLNDKLALWFWIICFILGLWFGPWTKDHLSCSESM